MTRHAWKGWAGAGVRECSSKFDIMNGRRKLCFRMNGKHGTVSQCDIKDRGRFDRLR